jgi:hypothetical protein
MTELPAVPNLYPDFKDTPRTFWHRVVNGNFFISMPRAGHPDTVAFAQQLERELLAAQERIRELEEAAVWMYKVGFVPKKD